MSEKRTPTFHIGRVAASLFAVAARVARAVGTGVAGGAA
jgi:hypothetical protein